MHFSNFIIYSILIVIGLFLVGITIHVIVNVWARSFEEDSYKKDFSPEDQFSAYKVSALAEDSDPEDSLKRYSVKKS